MPSYGRMRRDIRKATQKLSVMSHTTSETQNKFMIDEGSALCTSCSVLLLVRSVKFSSTKPAGKRVRQGNNTSPVSNDEFLSQ